MRILFVNRFLPHSKVRDSGGQDTYHYIRSLAKTHQISLISFVKNNEGEAVKELEGICERVVSVLFDEANFLGRIQRLVQRNLLGRVYGRNWSWTYRATLKQLLQTHPFDIVIIDGPMGLYASYPTCITCYDAVDLYADVAHDRWLDSRSPLLWWDWQLTNRREATIINTCDAVLVRSQKDKEKVNTPAHTLSPWFEGLEELTDISLIRPSQPNILFMGAMQNPKNIQAVHWFVQKVFPLIQKPIPTVSFTILGANPPASIRDLASNAITITGEVPHFKPYYKNASVNIAPLPISGGIIVKTLNGLAAGRPTVATRAGNSGTGARHNQDGVLITDNPAQFAAHIIHLLQDEDEWFRHARDGRAFIQANYDWNTIITDFDRFLAQITPK